MNHSLLKLNMGLQPRELNCACIRGVSMHSHLPLNSRVLNSSLGFSRYDLDPEVG